MVRFDDYIEHTGKATEPDDATRNPYTWRHGQDGKPVWEIMAQYPDRIQTFQVGLAGQEAAVPIVGYYDFSKLKTDEENRVELVDVGGGQGQSLKQILEAHPDLSPSKMVLQETPDVIKIAQATKMLPDSVVKMEHDFYTEQPVKGSLLPHSAFGDLTVNLICRRTGLLPPPYHARLQRRCQRPNLVAARESHETRLARSCRRHGYASEGG